jgi:hypothetical protein
MTVFDTIVSELLSGRTALLFAGLIVTAAVLRRVGPEAQRRTRVLTLLFAGHVFLALCAAGMRLEIGRASCRERVS